MHTPLARTAHGAAGEALDVVSDLCEGRATVERTGAVVVAEVHGCLRHGWKMLECGGRGWDAAGENGCERM